MRGQENYGKLWSVDDERDLRQLFQQNFSPDEIAAHLGRTRSAVLGRLASFQLVQWDNQVRQYFKIVWLGK